MVAMHRVELFKTGTYKVLDHKNKRWVKRRFGPADLEQIVRNFERFQRPGQDRQHKLNIVKGHVPGDVYDPAIPKHGSVNRVYRDGDKLLYDADDVDPEFANEVSSGRFDDVSAEIYESPEEAGLDGSGLMLRRVAILGGDVPKVKGLNPEGLDKTLRFSEGSLGCTILCNTFSEGNAMGRDEMIQMLLEKGMSQDVLDTLDDVQLAEILKISGASAPEADDMDADDAPAAAEPPATPPAEMPPPAPDASMAAPAAPMEDENLPDVGEDKDASAMKYAEMCSSYKKAHKMKFGEDLDEQGRGASPAAPMNDNAPGMSFSEQHLKSIVSEIVKPIREQIGAEVNDTRRELKRQRVQMFCETESMIGRISPAEMDSSAGPNLVERLLQLDDNAKVHKFSENGSTRELTQLDAELRAIRQRPIKYRDEGRKIVTGTKGVMKFSEASEDVRKAKFMSFAEQHADDLAKMGFTPQEVVDAWTFARSKGDLDTAAGLEKSINFE